MLIPAEEIHRLISELDSLSTGERAAARLGECGPAAVEPLRRFLKEGKPGKIFQPRLRAVKALAALRAKDALLEYLLQRREIPDPEDRFGEEAVQSAAARFLATWPAEDVYETLLKLSEERMLVGLIEALAEFERPEALPYFERALADDFYRHAAEAAFIRSGSAGCDTLVLSAVTPVPSSEEETPSSLQRRRSALGLLTRIGMPAEQWRNLRALIHESDEELVVGASRLGIAIASAKDRRIMAQRLTKFLSLAPWYLEKDIEDTLVLLREVSVEEIESEISRRMREPEHVRAGDERLRALARVRRRLGAAESP